MVATHSSRLDGTGKEDPLLAEATQLRSSPAFEDAVRLYTDSLIRSREDQWIVNKMISQDARFRVIGYLLYLDADHELWPGGATYSRLNELCSRRNEASPRILKTMLALLQITGFVTVVRDIADKRVKFYRPTARMAAFVDQWLDYAVRALDLLQPQADRAALLRNNSDFIKRFLMMGGRDHLNSETPASRMPGFVQYFGAHEGGAAVVLTVMQCEIEQAPLPSRASIAKRFGLSKTQVSNVVAEGVQCGFLTLTPQLAFEATDILREQFRDWIAIELAFYARHMRP